MRVDVCKAGFGRVAVRGGAAGTLLLVLLLLSVSDPLRGQDRRNTQQRPEAFREASQLRSTRVFQSVGTGQGGQRLFGVPAPLRSSLTGEGAWQAGRVPERLPANVRFRALEMRFEASFAARYDSNVNLSNTNPIADFILLPGFDVDLRWAVTPFNELEFRIGLQYEKYLRSVDRDRSVLRLAPDTELVYRVFVADLLFTFYERPNVTQDPGEDSGLTNIGDFRLFRNNAGAIVFWDLNDVLLSAGIDRGDVVSLNDNFTSEDRVTYAVFGSAAVRLTPTDLLGIEASFANTNYREPVLNDFDYLEIGGFLESTLSQYTSIRFEAGVQHFTFFPTGTPISQQAFVAQQAAADAAGTEQTDVSGTLGGGDFTGPFFRLQISNRLNRYLSHALSIGVEAQASEISNFKQIYFLQYGVDWRVNRYWNAGLNLLYQHVDTSGGDQADYDQFSVRIGLTRQLSRKVSLTLDYRGDYRTSVDAFQSYNRNQLQIGLDYRF